MPVKKCQIPKDSFLDAYASLPGCHTDCFSVGVSDPVTLPDFIGAFFTSPVFRLERWVLAVFAAAKTTDMDIGNLASGKSDRLAMWVVEARKCDQIILAVGSGPIRSWLMVAPNPNHAQGAILHFGSVVLPMTDAANGTPKIGLVFRLFLGFHKFYSRILLWSAKRNILRT